MPHTSPLKPETMPDMPPVAGVQLASIAAGIKYKGRNDVWLAMLEPGTAIAGVFTQSYTAAPPVQWCRNILPHGRAQAILVNSGNANAFTHEAGFRALEEVVHGAGQVLVLPEEEIYVASTGVIGEPLPQDRILKVLPGLHAELSEEGEAWEVSAKTIMTTDTFPKYATRTVELEGKQVTLNGICKGSGMIAPNMATMLGFIFTDASLSPTILQALLSEANHKSFNAITVDSDTSTNDTVLLCATGKAAAGADITDPKDTKLDAFRTALHALMLDLAQLIIRDGEGASKFITVHVEGAASETDARTIAMSIANSPLVKTAIAGEDANWGRVVMAVGKAGIALDQHELAIRFGDIAVAEGGMRVPSYDEEQTSAYMRRQDIGITVNVGMGNAAYTAYTCDLTHGYISINADYRS